MESWQVLAWVTVIVIVLGVVLRARFRRVLSAERDAIYRAVDAFLTPAERSFFGVLEQAVTAEYYTFAKVRLIDLVTTRRGVAQRQAHINRIVAKHVDFVLCERTTLRPLMVVELDDASHERVDRRTRDGFVDQCLVDAGIPILRVRAAHRYEVTEVRRQVQALLCEDHRGPL